MIELKGEVKVTGIFESPASRIGRDGTRPPSIGITNGRMSHTLEFRNREEAEAERERYLEAGAVPV